ncbi:MAG TPA: alpha/beta hydrolase [Nocardioidaceae bacterium]|nr:alpha/beta hydrolase [Nocardioidaceae bacterium]
MAEPTDFRHIWVPPERSGEPTVLALHGTGADEHDLLPLARLIAPGAGVLSPRGQVLERGMPRWFARHAEGVFDTDDLVRRAGELADFVDDAAVKYGFDRDNVVAIGFSNGANIAGGMLLTRPGSLRGAVLLGAMVPLRPEPRPDLSEVAVLIGNGRNDPIAPAEQAEELARMLDDAGASVQMAWHDGGHEVTADVVETARAWLAKLRTATGSPPLP